MHPLDPDLDPRTKKTASGAVGSLYSWSTATGIRTPVSGLRIRRPSPLDDSGKVRQFSERGGRWACRGSRTGIGARIGRLVGLAAVAELVDAHGSGPCGLTPVKVRLLSAASWATALHPSCRAVFRFRGAARLPTGFPCRARPGLNEGPPEGGPGPGDRRSATDYAVAAAPARISFSSSSRNG